jgi:hypothetical protein
MNWIILVFVVNTSATNFTVGAFETVQECEQASALLVSQGKYRLESLKCVDSGRKIY